MADVLRLQIVYETSQAISGATRLTTATGHLSREQSKATIAALHLAKGLSEGNISAVTLARSIEHLGGKIAGAATVIGLAAAAFALWIKHTEEQEKLSKSLAKEVEAAHVAMMGLLGVEESSTEKQVRTLTERIKELQDELNKPNWFEKLMATVGAFMNAPRVAPGDRFGVAARQAAGAAFLAKPDPREAAIKALTEQRDALSRKIAGDVAQSLGLGTGGIVGGFNQTGATGAAFNRPVSFSPGAARGPSFGADLSGLQVHPTVPGESPMEEELTRQQERIVTAWVDGLDTMEHAVEDFLVTGKFAIQQMIDEFLRIAFRAASGQFLDMATSKVIEKIGGSSAAKRAIK